MSRHWLLNIPQIVPEWTKGVIIPDFGPLSKFVRFLRPLAGGITILVAGALVLIALHNVSHEFSYHALMRALRRTPATVIAWSMAATAVSFAALILRDLFALRCAGVKPPISSVVLAGFCGSALGNAVGFGALTGGAVRYRLYGSVGMRPDDIGRVIIFIMLGGVLGPVGFLALLVLFASVPVATLLNWPAFPLRLIAGICLAALVGLIQVCSGRSLRLGQFLIVGPDSGLAAVQFAAIALDLAAAGVGLWVLMPSSPVDVTTFLAIFTAATGLGVISHVPGGIGVFEAVIVVSFGRQAPPSEIAAALLVYRGLYFGLPLLFSGIVLAIFELRLASNPSGTAAGQRLVSSAGRLSPNFVGAITFAVGIMLIFSGATPAFGERLAALSFLLPLWAVEAAHFLDSLIGVLFLYLGRSLLYRLEDAWWVTLGLSVTSLGLSLAKGLAYGEATVIATLIVLLIMTRPQFDRPASMLGQPFTGSWFAAVAVIVAAAFWLLFFAFQDVRYTRDLWWQFEFDAEAPRALRATVGVATLAMSLALLQLLRPPKGLAAKPSTDALYRAQAIIEAQEHPTAVMALMGDKSLMFSASGKAFIMFARRGRSWIALSDPVGPCSEWPELVWRFVEQADSHGGRAAFYEVRPESLPLYLDAGLRVMKLGEEAIVSLACFDLAGPRFARLRYALSRGERDGLTLELFEPHRASAVMDVIEIVSDEWLKSRASDEKRFSVAAFQPGFVSAQWVALVRKRGQPIAFATVMATGSRQGAAVGLMRYRRGVSAYAMEFLFTKLLLAFKDAGYRRFSLGMAPLSGIQPTPLCSGWHHLGSLIWRHANWIYNFQGLRIFKAKFNPAWEPRYLVASGVIGPFVALADVARLTTGGIAGGTDS